MGHHDVKTLAHRMPLEWFIPSNELPLPFAPCSDCDERGSVCKRCGGRGSVIDIGELVRRREEEVGHLDQETVDGQL